MAFRSSSSGVGKSFLLPISTKMGWCKIVKQFSLFGFKVALTQSNVLLAYVYFDSFMNMPEPLIVAASGDLRSRIISLLVSFFGASHITMPLQEAKLSTNIRLKFRTRHANAMIFLTGGRTDHCLLTLNDGNVKVQLKINEYELEVRQIRNDFDHQLTFHVVSVRTAKAKYLQRSAMARSRHSSIRDECDAPS